MSLYWGVKELMLDGYWKSEVKAQSLALKYNRTIFLVPKLQEHVVNKAILMTAIISRKILEDEKWAERESRKSTLPWGFNSELTKTKMPVMVFPYYGEPLPLGPVVPNHYGKGKEMTELVEYIVNSVIHSYYWVLIGSPHSSYIEAFCVSSDRHKDQLYYVKISDWIVWLQKVIKLCHI